MEGISSVNTTTYTPPASDARADVDIKGNKDTTAIPLNAERVAPEKNNNNPGKSSRANNKGKVVDNNSKSLLNPERLNNRSLRLDIDKDLNIVVAKIVDKKTGEVVKQIPPEEMVKLMKFYKEHPGALVSRQA